MKLYLGVSTSTYDETAIRCIVIDVDATYLARINRLQALVAQHDLSEVREFTGVDVVGPGDIGDPVSIKGEELCVFRDRFYVEGSDGDVRVTGASADTGRLVRALREGCEHFVVE